jgi:hypothetical protein
MKNELEKAAAQAKVLVQRQCAFDGHKFRSDVPGIQGVICTHCGERPAADENPSISEELKKSGGAPGAIAVLRSIYLKG